MTLPVVPFLLEGSERESDGVVRNALSRLLRSSKAACSRS